MLNFNYFDCPQKNKLCPKENKLQIYGKSIIIPVILTGFVSVRCPSQIRRLYAALIYAYL